MKNPSIAELVKRLNLKPLWGKDFLCEFYSSDVVLDKNQLTSDYCENRFLFNWAYYLLPEGVKCPLHKMYADESWQYCLGGPLELYMISPDGKEKKITIGKDVINGEELIYVVPKNWWFGAVSSKGSSYTLITHLVSPGFEYKDWEKGHKDSLIKMFPRSERLIDFLHWPVGYGESN